MIVIVALVSVLDMDEDDIMDRFKEFFEGKVPKPYKLPKPYEIAKNQEELHEHYSSFEKGELHKFKASVLSNLGAYRFYCKMAEEDNRGKAGIKLKDCAREYSQLHGKQDSDMLKERD